MDKKTEIIKKVLSIPLEKWQLKETKNAYPLHVTTINGVEILAYYRSGGAHFISINGVDFFDDKLINPFVFKLVQFTRDQEKKEEENKIDEIYNKLI